MAATAREGLKAALESRDLIGQAKGSRMERHQVTASAAFDLLREHPQSRNVKRREVAVQLSRTGRLP